MSITPVALASITAAVSVLGNEYLKGIATEAGKGRVSRSASTAPVTARAGEAASALTVVRDGTAAAMRYGLTAYDAAYLDLASREKLTLATSRTLDTAMRKAAEQSGITIFRQ